MESKAEFVAKPERYCSIVVPALVTRALMSGELRSRCMVHASSINGRKTMKKSILAIVLASSVSLSACATNDRMAGDVAEGAAYGAAGGAAIGAVVPLDQVA